MEPPGSDTVEKHIVPAVPPPSSAAGSGAEVAGNGGGAADLRLLIWPVSVCIA